MTTARGQRVRVSRLARETGIPVEQVRSRLEQLGHTTTSGASTVPATAADLLREVVRPFSPFPDPPPRRGPYGLLLPYVVHRKRGLVQISLATFAASGLALLVPLPIKLLADNLLAEGRATGVLGALPFTDSKSVAVAYLAVGTILLFGASTILDIKLTLLWVRVGNTMVYELAGDVLRALQRRSLTFHSRAPIGDSISRVMVDSFGLQATLQALVFAPLHAVVMTTAMVVVLVNIDATLALAAVAAAVLMTVASLFLGRAIRRVSRAAREAETSLQSHLHQALSGVAVVQSFAAEHRETIRFQGYADEIVRMHGRGTLLTRLNVLGSGLPGAVGTAIILWLAASRVLVGSMKVGTMLLFMTYLGSLTAQVRVLASVYGSLQGSRAFIDRVLEVLDAQPEVRQHPDARAIESARGHVCFVGVGFSYEPGRPVLSDVSLEIRPGETVALVGHSGAGKTTLLSLLPRFFDPTEGSILLDGRDLRHLTLHSVREQVSVVLQEPFLFPVSIAENIAYGRPEASRDEIEAAARTANAHEFIADLPEGYDTVVGERGGTLSGGQRQRVSIARALLKDAPVLVLDEPTSALDPVSERQLLIALKRLMVGRTTLMIAHRLSTVRDADRIVVMDRGRVLEVGNHAQLMRRKGAYAGMHASQVRRRPRQKV